MAGKENKNMGQISKFYPSEFMIGTTGHIIADFYRIYSGLDWWDKTSKGIKGALSVLAGVAGITLFWTVPSVTALVENAVLALTASSVVALPEVMVLTFSTIVAWSLFARVTRTVSGEIFDTATKAMFRVKNPEYYVTHKERNELINDYLEIPGNEHKERAEAAAEVDEVIKKFLDALNDKSKEQTKAIWEIYFRMLKSGEYEAYQSALVAVEKIKSIRKEAKNEKLALEGELNELNQELSTLKGMYGTDEVVIDMSDIHEAPDVSPEGEMLKGSQASDASTIQRFWQWMRFKKDTQPSETTDKKETELKDIASGKDEQSLKKSSSLISEDAEKETKEIPVLMVSKLAMNSEEEKDEIPMSSDVEDDLEAPDVSSKTDKHQHQEKDENHQILQSLTSKIKKSKKKKKAKDKTREVHHLGDGTILPLFKQCIEHSKSTREQCRQDCSSAPTRTELNHKIQQLEKEKMNIVAQINARRIYREHFKL